MVLWTIRSGKLRMGGGGIMSRGGTRLLVGIAAVAAALAATRARAQETFDRPIVITVAGTAGGGIDLYARLLARHLARHVPGHPGITVQVMPGAGGIRAAAYVANAAPRDGTALVTFAGGPVL